mgnify:CR=1 FL=1
MGRGRSIERIFRKQNARLLGRFLDQVAVGSIHRVLPVGGEIEQLDDGTLFSAFKNRVPVTDI